MNTLKKYFSKLGMLGIALSIPATASAHEVYVLSHEVIARDLAANSPDPFSIIKGSEGKFLLWGFISALTIVLVLLFSLTKKMERRFDPMLFRLKKYAPFVARVTFGICLITSGYFGALFGPELPFPALFGTYTPYMQVLFYALGVSILLGKYVRTCSAVMLLVFLVSIYDEGYYMLTYTNYLGEIMINLLLGAGAPLFSKKEYIRTRYDAFFEPLEKYAFLALRVLFGISVIFASIFAKFIHSQMALDVVNDYHLTNYFHFPGLFVVLGAGIIEILIGLFFVIGFEIRFTALVFLTFLALSLSYFGEAVWPHLILIGVNIALFMRGYDRLTLEEAIFKQKGNLEPVL